MLRLSKVQFSRAIEGADVSHDKKAPRSSKSKSNRTSRFLLAALIAALGIGAGWIGGKVLNGRSSDSVTTATPPAVSTGEGPVQGAQPQADSRHVKRAATQEQPDISLESAPDLEQPAAESESRVTGAKANGIPPKVPRIEKDEESEKASAEDPSKEIGRDALKKMSKENQKMQRGSGNKNENDD